MKIGSRGLDVLGWSIGAALAVAALASFLQGGSMPAAILAVLILLVAGRVPRFVVRLFDRASAERWGNELTALGIVLGAAAAAAVIAFWSWPQS